MRDATLAVVNAHSGIRLVDLGLKVIERVSPAKFYPFGFYEVITELVTANEIIELEYSDSDIPGRKYKIYFKKGTVFFGFWEVNKEAKQNELDRKGQGDT